MQSRVIKSVGSIVLIVSLCAALFGGSVNDLFLSVRALEGLTCNATLEDNFTDNEILITVFPQWNQTEYTPSDFSTIGCTSIEEKFTPWQDDTPSRILKLILNQNSKQNVLDAIRVLEQRDDVYCAEPNYMLEMCAAPNDPQYVSGEQWAIDQIELPSVWNTTTGSASVKVGIIDSGIDGDHPDLVNRIDVGLSKNFYNNVDDPLEDLSGHGTQVAGIIGAQGNNAQGVTGVCWNVRLVSLRIVNFAGVPITDCMVAAINYARTVYIPILSCSMGSTQNNSLSIAIDNYTGLFVCAAGNYGEDNDVTPHYPSAYHHDNVIVVGASTVNDCLKDGCNWGRNSVDIFAPGDSILTTNTGGGYTTVGMTSMATPHVAGVAALLLSENPGMSPQKMKQIILGHAENVYDENGNSVFENYCVSGGRLNARMVFSHNERVMRTSSLYTHNYTCLGCGYTREESHNWIETAVNFRCTICSMIATEIPVLPNDYANYAAFLNINCIGSNDEPIAVKDGTYLYYSNGEYYLVKRNSSEDE